MYICTYIIYLFVLFVCIYSNLYYIFSFLSPASVMLRLNPFTVAFLGWNDVNGGQQWSSCRVLTWSLFCNQCDINVTGLWIRVSPSNELGQKSAVISLGLRFSHRRSQRSRPRSRAARSCRNFPIRLEVFPQSHPADQEEPPANPFSRPGVIREGAGRRIEIAGHHYHRWQRWED